MKRIATAPVASALIALAALAGLQSPAWADDDHHRFTTHEVTEKRQHGPRMEMITMLQTLERAGYRDFRDVELDDGHYEVEARNRHGQRVELDVHSVTGKVLRTELDD